MSLIEPAEILREFSVIATALSKEKNHELLLDQIIDSSMTLTNADGGTLYTLSDQRPNELLFTVIRNRSLGIHNKPTEWPPVMVRDAQGRAGKLVSVQCFVRQETINIENSYTNQEYDFSGTRKFDKQLNYRSQSFLCVPLQDHEGEIIGVLQLINALDEAGEPIPFSDASQQLVESLASLAATVLTKQRLIEAQKNLFESFIKLIGQAIDHKSPVTGKHCEQVPEIAMLMADAVNQACSGEFADVQFSADELYELKIAAWLHDCGKITTPEYIIDKATKLHTMFDRIELVARRIQILKQQWQLDYFQSVAELSAAQQQEANTELQQRLQQLDDDLEFLRRSNTGGEFMAREDKERVQQLATLQWRDEHGEEQPLLTDDEVENLCIAKGTLTEDERQVMRDHIKVSIDMLDHLKYPRYLAEVPEIACNHHEHMDGTGYPRGLTGDQLSLRARIMCIADIFEALTSPDRPYKKGMQLSQAMTIMGRMVEDHHLDPALFKLFVESGAYRQYAQRHMAERQIDEFDADQLPGLN